MEHSGSDVLRLRFLDAMFPQGERYFIIGSRHPAAAVFDQWPRSSELHRVGNPSLRDAVEHWLLCMETAREDILRLENVVVVDDALMHDHAQSAMQWISSWLGVQLLPFEPLVVAARSRWHNKYYALPEKDRTAVIDEFEQRVAAFGYSLRNLTLSPSLHAAREHSGIELPTEAQAEAAEKATAQNVIVGSGADALISHDDALEAAQMALDKAQLDDIDVASNVASAIASAMGSSDGSSSVQQRADVVSWKARVLFYPGDAQT